MDAQGLLTLRLITWLAAIISWACVVVSVFHERKQRRTHQKIMDESIEEFEALRKRIVEMDKEKAVFEVFDRLKKNALTPTEIAAMAIVAKTMVSYRLGESIPWPAKGPPN